MSADLEIGICCWDDGGYTVELRSRVQGRRRTSALSGVPVRLPLAFEQAVEIIGVSQL